jgi:glycine/D-amino acid oxidase-like deaminating enzyme
VEETDCVVVSGGVYGAALAYELVARGASAALLEAGRAYDLRCGSWVSPPEVVGNRWNPDSADFVTATRRHQLRTKK